MKRLTQCHTAAVQLVFFPACLDAVLRPPPTQPRELRLLHAESRGLGPWGKEAKVA